MRYSLEPHRSRWGRLKEKNVDLLVYLVLMLLGTYYAAIWGLYYVIYHYL
jgi:hypothetical protein